MLSIRELASDHPPSQPHPTYQKLSETPRRTPRTPPGSTPGGSPGPLRRPVTPPRHFRAATKLPGMPTEAPGKHPGRPPRTLLEALEASGTLLGRRTAPGRPPGGPPEAPRGSPEAPGRRPEAPRGPPVGARGASGRAPRHAPRNAPPSWLPNGVPRRGREPSKTALPRESGCNFSLFHASRGAAS